MSVTPDIRRSIQGSTPALDAARQEGLKAGFYCLARHDVDLDMLEASLLEETVENALLEAQPNVGVELARLLEIMLL